jgi:hypothetical protein
MSDKYSTVATVRDRSNLATAALLFLERSSSTQRPRTACKLNAQSFSLPAEAAGGGRLRTLLSLPGYPLHARRLCHCASTPRLPPTVTAGLVKSTTPIHPLWER